jgi:hypothetical protein
MYAQHFATAHGPSDAPCPFFGARILRLFAEKRPLPSWRSVAETGTIRSEPCAAPPLPPLARAAGCSCDDHRAFSPFPQWVV